MSNRLAAKVQAVNKANQYATTLYPTLVDIFRPLVGTKIIKADGSLLKKVQALVPDFHYSTDLHVYRLSSSYSLAWVVKTCEPITEEGTCTYYEATVYVGSLDGDTLKSIYEHPFREKTDFTVEEIQAARTEYDKARKIAEDLKSALFPFGEHDNG